VSLALEHAEPRIIPVLKDKEDVDGVIKKGDCDPRNWTAANVVEFLMKNGCESFSGHFDHDVNCLCIFNIFFLQEWLLTAKKFTIP